MKKELIQKRILHKYWYRDDHVIRMSDITDIELEPNDIIDIIRTEAEDCSDGLPAMTELSIYRERLETDKELELRKKRLKKKAEESKKSRYRTYLNLKKEFENEFEIILPEL